MTLLESTTLLIECARTHASHCRMTMWAVKRMEKRLEILQARADQSTKRRRDVAWLQLQHFIPKCECGEVFSQVEFWRDAAIDGHGEISSFDCPVCRAPVIRLEKVDAKCARYVFQGMPELKAFLERNE